MTSMKPPFLFLDFDGVLHPTLCNENEFFRLLPDLARCLASAAQECQIVISSSWSRVHPTGPAIAGWS
jgi:predicted ATPase